MKCVLTNGFETVCVPGSGSLVGSGSGSLQFVNMRTIFPDELPGLPPHRDANFTIELHLGTSPISMTPH